VAAFGIEQFQNGGRCHGNQGAKNVNLFIAMATAAKFVQPIPIVFGLSRSTRCGCCSYQVSSISVRSYDVS
jgi:hypothetical protein